MVHPGARYPGSLVVWTIQTKMQQLRAKLRGSKQSSGSSSAAISRMEQLVIAYEGAVLLGVLGLALAKFSADVYMTERTREFERRKELLEQFELQARHSQLRLHHLQGSLSFWHTQARSSEAKAERWRLQHQVDALRQQINSISGAHSNAEATALADGWLQQQQQHESSTNARNQQHGQHSIPLWLQEQQLVHHWQLEPWPGNVQQTASALDGAGPLDRMGGQSHSPALPSHPLNTLQERQGQRSSCRGAQQSADDDYRQQGVQPCMGQYQQPQHSTWHDWVVSGWQWGPARLGAWLVGHKSSLYTAAAAEDLPGTDGNSSSRSNQQAHANSHVGAEGGGIDTAAKSLISMVWRNLGSSVQQGAALAQQQGQQELEQQPVVTDKAKQSETDTDAGSGACSLDNNIRLHSEGNANHWDAWQDICDAKVHRLRKQYEDELMHLFESESQLRRWKTYTGRDLGFETSMQLSPALWSSHDVAPQGKNVLQAMFGSSNQPLPAASTQAASMQVASTQAASMQAASTQAASTQGCEDRPPFSMGQQEHAGLGQAEAQGSLQAWQDAVAVKAMSRPQAEQQTCVQEGWAQWVWSQFRRKKDVDKGGVVVGDEGNGSPLQGCGEPMMVVEGMPARRASQDQASAALDTSRGFVALDGSSPGSIPCAACAHVDSKGHSGSTSAACVHVDSTSSVGSTGLGQRKGSITVLTVRWWRPLWDATVMEDHMVAAQNAWEAVFGSSHQPEEVDFDVDTTPIDL